MCGWCPHGGSSPGGQGLGQRLPALPVQGEQPVLLLILLYVALIAIDSIIRLYIGLCAVSEGRGRWKHSVYLVITAVYLIVNILLSYSTLVDIFDWDMFVNDPHFFEETLTTTIIDLSCNLTFVLILIASIKLRYLAKKSRDLNAESNKTVTGNN